MRLEAQTTESDRTDPASAKPSMYTTSFAFFEALVEAGVKNCFVNLGSDHPSILEAMVRGQRELKDKFPRIITCPNEMVALSMADGYARLSGEAQCVIVHVDVGTSALAAAIHNAAMGRAPVLIFAGLSPYSIEGELLGSRTEFIHWIQDVPDQKQIVSQYCRYVGEIKTGKNVKQMVRRALQLATSHPQGPSYLMGAREVMEETIEPYTINSAFWKPVAPAALPQPAVQEIAEALVNASDPLVIVGFTGRNHAAVEPLVALANTIKGLRVLDTGCSDMCFPADHPGWLGMKYGVDSAIQNADVFLILDCDVPWINKLCKPKNDARIFHLDVDPLKESMLVFYIDAEQRYRVDAETSLRQITDYLRASLSEKLATAEFDRREQALQKSYTERIQALDAKAKPLDSGKLTTDYVCSTLRAKLPEDTIWAVEAITNMIAVADQIRATIPGQWIHCGGGGLGWSGGGALGIKLAADAADALVPNKRKRYVVQIVGDGSYMFSVPSSVYWISARYGIPVLTIVLNNLGWNAPKRSMLLVHPDGPASRATNEELNISFAPSPDYAGIAKAASNGVIFGARVADISEFQSALAGAVESLDRGVSAPMTTSGPVSFFGLSGELRNAIYKIILLQSEPVDPWLRCGLQVLTGLFRVSKTVHHEASLLFYSQNCFDFAGRDPETIASFLRQIGTRNASSIRHIIIDFPEFIHLDPGDITIDEESVEILGNILSSCTSLSTLRTSLHSTWNMEVRLDNLDHDSIATEALHLVNTHFRAIPSLPEIILEVYEDGTRDSLRRKMKSCGWVLSENPNEEEEYWDRRLSDIDSDDYGYGYDDDNNSYDDDDYDIDNDSDFWRRAAD
ncbi:Benzoylformate decarboxylase [Fusarium tjaetaba]|uniref:Benzoylformate decarboxylase n=1 Tax=Fusarium tjaetaba TaxID=1567544 RepID=A0A8H5S3X4_9HYPO|nr:Benzoylformate decarboxylase [Fusarium tjaetaba]KAF5643416.1 Benzoylformate decarboxylase [Fusarium tjaetaba]